MRLWPFLIALTVGGCRSVLGLDDTELARDSDRDGVLDGEDNCPDVGNKTQADLDHNGIGDACEFCRNGADLDHDGIDDGCDPCDFGINDEDEDADGIADGCDNCPKDFGADQTDSDGDTLGNLCDLVPGTQGRRYFDGFRRDVPVWTSRIAWPIEAGHRTSPMAAINNDLELAAVRVYGSAPGEWAITTRLRLPANTGQSGIRLFDESRLAELLCGFEMGPGGANLVIREAGLYIDPASDQPPIVGTQSFPPGSPVVLRLAFDQTDKGSDVLIPTFVCSAGTETLRYERTLTPTSFGIALRGTDPTTFEYVDVIAP